MKRILLQEGKYSKAKKEKHTLSAVIDTAYWSIATAIYLGYSLLFNHWSVSWVIWVVAGVLFPALVAVANFLNKKSD